ncbi:MAG TPA: hypothetical protein VJH91_01960 [Candidatus Paceibacterota bacterium]|uniref:Transcriptional repressor PaaX-like central Cas2-like domain-containing protein n=1 Tax=Candidatus Ryanbacteria bacterium RIFCSPHIGHO2_01_FULL_48_27 TaxID=1802115 RepID=A0A1G2G2X7_9BACT|nr:MAG: hypothetical protein A2756_03190 [Candidatus Ryanbacteria bacterium RIFCSPHIGHO2_01_FULL_48_27]
MGRQEAESKKRAKKAALKKIILESVQAVGVLGLALTVPNVLGAMGKLGLVPAARQGESIGNARQRMIKQGLLAYVNGGVRLTPKGERELRRLELNDVAEQRPRKWDGKWRVLIFDIPDRRKGLRDRVRQSLKMIGFEKLQGSVWAYPYNCEDVVAMLKVDLRVGYDMQYLIVDSIENDTRLRTLFELPKH